MLILTHGVPTRCLRDNFFDVPGGPRRVDVFTVFTVLCLNLTVRLGLRMDVAH